MATVEANVAKVFALFEKHGDHMYLGENITQTSHMIQAAMNAEKAEQPPAVVLGTMLHDIGNLAGQDMKVERVVVDNVDVGPKDHGVVGEQFLKECGFPLEIYCFSRGHSHAMRYLAYKDPLYKDSLSQTQLQALTRRGGPMTSTEAADFEKLPNYEAVIKCRDWDSNAKDPKAKLEPLDKYKQMAVAYLKSVK